MEKTIQVDSDSSGSASPIEPFKKNATLRLLSNGTVIDDDGNIVGVLSTPQKEKNSKETLLSPSNLTREISDPPQENIIKVVKRNGKTERLDLSKISKRLAILVNMEPKIKDINLDRIQLEVAGVVHDKITTYEIDELVASRLSNMYSEPQYLDLAARIKISNHQKSTSNNFIEKIKSLHYNAVNGHSSPIIRRDFYKFCEHNADRIQSMIDYKRDYKMDYFGFCTYLKMYSLKCNKKPVERPQDTYMRMAIEMHAIFDMSKVDDEQKIKELDKMFANIKKTYDMLSNMLYIHGSPTIFNSGCKKPQMASCFLLGCDDSTESIMETASRLAFISRSNGGIGLHLHALRSRGSRIKSSDEGISSGIIRFIQLMSRVVMAFDQNGKRKGAAAIYLSLHHPDILDFIDIRLITGNQDMRDHNIFPALWISDLFMKRVLADEIWSLFDPDECGDLSLLWGESYEKRYLELEQQKKYRTQLPAREIWTKVYNSKVTTGLPYICFADNANKCNMQQNIGILQSSNLCSEIFEVNNYKETAVCNLCSISLPAFVQKDENVFDFNKLIEVVMQAVINNNKIIDKTYYPIQNAETSNMSHRPIGIGIQGLADVYQMFDLPFASEEAAKLNKAIFETIYYAALLSSCSLAKEFGPYSTFAGSPLSEGKFHWELFGKKKEDLIMKHDWDSLREKIKKFGVRNSLLIALMPTATSSFIMGNNECFEPFLSNIYSRQTLTGDFVVVNKHLVRKLKSLNLWSNAVVDYMKIHDGSVAGCRDIPEQVREIFKIAYEVDQSALVRQAIDRQPFIDQGQSFNLFFRKISFLEFNKIMFQAWRGGLKTGNYYLRTAPSVKMQNFTIDPDLEEKYRKIVESQSSENQKINDESNGKNSEPNRKNSESNGENNAENNKGASLPKSIVFKLDDECLACSS